MDANFENQTAINREKEYAAHAHFLWCKFFIKGECYRARSKRYAFETLPWKRSHVGKEMNIAAHDFFLLPANLP